MLLVLLLRGKYCPGEGAALRECLGFRPLLRLDFLIEAAHCGGNPGTAYASEASFSTKSF
ncbi:hypothetical protein AWJ19_32835 [Paenibacillus sp. DMB5]|nr:hypothetical protein AWJ19_32835 [Paenibacillus sp. DMB5]